jgi:hypothetical protein
VACDSIHPIMSAVLPQERAGTITQRSPTCLREGEWVPLTFREMISTHKYGINAMVRPISPPLPLQHIYTYMHTCMALCCPPAHPRVHTDGPHVCAVGRSRSSASTCTARCRRRAWTWGSSWASGESSTARPYRVRCACRLCVVPRPAAAFSPISTRLCCGWCAPRGLPLVVAHVL